MLGVYDNFPVNIHLSETLTSALSKRKLQERIIQVLQEVNRKTFSFEEVGSPNQPNCTIIFEFGIANGEVFSYLDEEEARKMQYALAKDAMQIIDWYCSVRYYKNVKKERTPLKFDYYMLRMNFIEKGAVELLVFHERGPRYISAEEIVDFIESKVNQTSNRKILKRTQQN